LPIRAVIRRKSLWLGLVAGLGFYAALMAVPNAFAVSTRALLAWDGAILVDLAALYALLHNADSRNLARRAALTDEGSGFILTVLLLAVAASVVAIILEAGATRSAPSALKGARVAFVFVTVALSWLFVHATFANHYAHEFYGPTTDKKSHRGGLIFPDDDKPDFWDFVHFALVIGVANQTADVQISSKTIRKIVTLHGIIAFVFNTIILALAINFAASMI
jgi:uncharacterized membrane protein